MQIFQVNIFRPLKRKTIIEQSERGKYIQYFGKKNAILIMFDKNHCLFLNISKDPVPSPSPSVPSANIRVNAKRDRLLLNKQVESQMLCLSFHFGITLQVIVFTPFIYLYIQSARKKIFPLFSLLGLIYLCKKKNKPIQKRSNCFYTNRTKKS